jgi:hypothetical protein
MKDLEWHDVVTFFLVLYVVSGVVAKLRGKDADADRWEAMHLIIGGALGVGSVLAKRRLPA